MIQVDTHVVVWLVAGEFDRIPDALLARIEHDDIALSPMVELELAFLHEIGRIAEGATPILAELRRSIGLQVDGASFGRVAAAAATERFGFTRDPFDRIIAAQAAVSGVPLISKDRAMRTNLDFVLWD